MLATSRKICFVAISPTKNEQYMVRQAFVLTLVFLIGFAVIAEFNTVAFHHINCWGPDWLQKTMLAITTLADGFFIIILAAVFYPARRGFFLRFIMVLLVGTVIVHTFKFLTAVPRPAGVFDGSEICTLGFEVSKNSFPSGHSFAAFTFASYLAYARSRWAQFFFYALGTLAAASRVYVGAHFPVDVWAGSWLGYALWQALAPDTYKASIVWSQYTSFDSTKPYCTKALAASILGLTGALGYLFLYREKPPELLLFFNILASGLALVLFWRIAMLSWNYFQRKKLK